ncbi:Ig-like domain-containing protein, partial [bacterium]|nr:Ig-like domain-containing protein [bacterium]
GLLPCQASLYYTVGNGIWTAINSNASSPYRWTVPTTINSSAVQIKVVIKDSLGVTAEAISPCFEVDSIPPSIEAITPANNAADIGITTNISITFSEEMNTDKTQGSFVISPCPGILGYRWNNGSTTLTVELKGTLSYNTTYTCMLSTSARDACAGNQLASNYVWSFTTKKIVNPLAVTLISPNGEKPCIAGDSKWPVAWSVSGGIQSYKTDLYYSMDNGNTWLPVVENVGNSPYNWQVPAIDSLYVKTRVVVTDALGQQASDISDAAFEIDSCMPTVKSTMPQDNATSVPIGKGSGTVNTLNIPDFIIPACPNALDYANCKPGKAVYSGTIVLSGIEFVNGDVTFDGIVQVVGTGAIVAAGNIYARDGITLQNIPDTFAAGIPIGLLAGGNIEISSNGDRMDVINTHVYAKGTIEIKPQYRSKYKLGQQGLLRAGKVHIYVANPGGGSETAGFGSEGRIYSEGDCNIWALRGKDAYTDLSLNGEVKAYGNIDLSTVNWDTTLNMNAHIQSKKNVWLKVTHRERVVLGKTGRIFAGESIKIYGDGNSCCFVSEDESKIYAKANIDIWCLAKDTINGEVFSNGSIELASNESDQNINIGALVCAYNGNVLLKVKHRAVLRLKRYAKLCASGDIKITTISNSSYFTSEDDTVISSRDAGVYIWALGGETLNGTINARTNIELATIDSDKSLSLGACVLAGGSIEVKAKYRERVVLTKTGRLLARGSIKTCFVLSGDFIADEGSIIQSGGYADIQSVNAANLKGSITSNYTVVLPIVTCCFGEINGGGNDNSIIISFSEEMNMAVTQQAFIINPNTEILGYEWSNGSSTLKIRLKPFDYGTKYTCVVTNQAKDTCAGNHMLKNYVWSFTTDRRLLPLSLELITPNGEKPCIAGNSICPVVWTASGGIQPYKASLYYSMDEGNAWTLIAENVVSPYNWQVPAIDSLHVRIKVVVTDAGNQQVSDTSDADFEIDSIPPSVISVSPLNGATNVLGSSTIIIKFSEEMNIIAAQEAFSISPNPGIEGYTWSDGTTTLTITVKPLTPDIKYYCQISKAAKDSACIPLAAVYEWSFMATKPFDSLGAKILAPNGGNTWRGQYSVITENITLPSGWGNTVVGSGTAVMEDVAVGDADNDGKSEVYGVCGSYIYQFKQNGATWTSTMIGTQKTYGLHAITIGDADNDGKSEVYAAYGPVGDWNGGVYQYKWDGSKFVEAWVYIEAAYCYGNYAGGTWKGALDVKIGDVDNDGQKELWVSDSKGYVYQLKCISGKWYSMFQVCAGPCYTFMTGIEIGDADGDGKNELYGAKNNGYIYQYKYVNSSWKYGTMSDQVGTQIADKMGDGIGFGDGDNDGKPEIYRAVYNGSLYQVKYNGSSWATTRIMENSCGYDVVVCDGDNDGKKDVYCVDMSQRVCQLDWNGTGWDKVYIGDAGAGLTQGMSIGDGNNDGKIELYGANDDKSIYQFRMAANISIDIQGRLIEGQTNAIRWEAIGGTPPYLSTLYYSIDGGYSYTLISSNIGTITFDWKVPAVNSKACLVKVVVTDSTGRSAVDMSDFFFEIDCIPPQIVNVSPTGRNIPITSDVVIGFDDVMNTAYTVKAFSIYPGVIINGYRWESYNNVMVVDLENLSYDTEYTCKVDLNAIDTCTGNPIMGVYTWKFRTMAQPDIPLPLKIELDCRGEVTQGDKICNTIRITKEGDWYQKWGWDEYMVVYKLDPNMSFVWSSPYGYYNAASNTLTWWVNMKDLAPGSSTVVWKAELNALVLPNAKPGSVMENKLMVYPGAIPSGIEPWLPMSVKDNTLIKYTGTQSMSLPLGWRIEEMMLSSDLMKRIGIGYWKDRLIAACLITQGEFPTDKDWTNDYYFNDFMKIIKNKFPQQFVFDQMKWKTISPWSVKALSRVIAAPAVIDNSWKKVKIGASVGDYVIGAVAIGDVDNNGRQEIYYGDVGNYLYQCTWNGKDWEAKQIAKMEWAIEAVTVGDGDNDGNDELYVVGQGRPVYQFEWDGASWIRTIVGEDGDGIFSVTIGDGNNDGINEIYVGCKNDWVYQFSWVNGFWVKSSVGECGSDIFKISIGDADNDGKKDVYIACEDGFVYSFKWVNNQWTQAKIAKPDSSMFSVSVGDGDNDGKEEIYGVCFDGHAYQFKWHEKGWIVTDMGVAGGQEERDGACSLQDGDNDGRYELYVSSKSGYVYQFKWDGTSWMRSVIGNVNVPLHYVAIGDGDGDGLYDVYAADGGVYQFKIDPQLSFRVETQKVSYAKKECVRIRLKITNYSSSERVLKFKTTKMFDLKIKSIGSGCVVYDWAYNKAFADGVAMIRLLPGEEQVLFEMDWDQKDLYGSNVSGGRYCIEANLADGRLGSHMEMRAKSKEIEICSAVPLWIPAVPAQQPYTEFDIEARIGTISNQVKDLFGCAFRLNYNVNEARLSVIRVDAGSFLGSDVISFTSSVDTTKGFVDIGLSRKKAAGIGVDGYGVVAKIRVKVDYISSSSLKLSLSNVSAVNSKGEHILMEASGTEIPIGGQVIVWPGDTNNDGRVDAND